MFTSFRTAPRDSGKLMLSTQGVAVPPPLDAPAPDSRPVWQRMMPVIVAVLMVAMIGMFVVLGVRALTSMLFTIPMMLMMLGMYATQMGNSGAKDIAQDIEDYDLKLREHRTEIYTQGEAMHNLRTLCFPNPADLLSLVGTSEMWQASPDLNHGAVVSPEVQNSDTPDARNARNLTSNPWLRARVGVGIAPLYPSLQRAEQTVIEQQEPVTMVRYQTVMNTLSVVANLPIDINLGEFRAYALAGAEASRLALVRSMLMSLAFNHRPGDLAIGVVTDDPQTWEWTKWLPHLEDLSQVEAGLGPRLLAWNSLEEFAEKYATVLDRKRVGSGPLAVAGEERQPHLLLIVDTADQNVSWPESIAGGMDGLTLLAVRYAADRVSQPESRILIDAEGRVSTLRDFDAATADAASITAADTFARAMYRLRPERYGNSGVVRDTTPDHIPDFLEALSIGDLDTHDVTAVWRENAYTNEITAPYGYLRNGEVITPELTYLNLYDENRDGDGPHGAVAGRPGAGKSFFLRAVILGLVARYGPDKLGLLLADFKGGATFINMENLPHTVAVISNLENSTELVERLGEVLGGEVDRRMQFITGDKKLTDIFDYRAEQRKYPNDPEWPPLPDLLVIIDEFGEFLKNNPAYLQLLLSIGRVGRSLGIHLMMCSQKMDRTIMGDLLDYSNFRFCLTVNDTSTSTALIGTDSAAKMVKEKGNNLKGKILRKLPSDAMPVEVVAFNHEAPYLRRSPEERARSVATQRGAAVTDAVIPFELFAVRTPAPVVEGEVIDAEVVADNGDAPQVGTALLEKISRLRDMKVVDLWQPSLREPLSLLDASGGLSSESSGLRIRLGDIDVPRKNTRLPWYVDFGGGLPHQVIAGADKSGRTTALQTLVVAGCLQHRSRLTFMLADFGSGKLGEVRNSPNVAAYARPGDSDTVDRILGEAGRLIDLRTRVMVEREVSSMDAYLASKAANPVEGDPYGYIIVAIDGIGGFLGTEKEGRPARAALLQPLIDAGAARGIHVVFTADSMGSGGTGNVAHYTLDLKGGIQLWAPDYSMSKVRSEQRATLAAKIPAGQPGRSVDPATMLQTRVMVPINRKIEPTGVENGMPVFAVEDYGVSIREVCDHLSIALAAERAVPVIPAADRIDFETIWTHVAPLLDPNRRPFETVIPLGFDAGTLLPAAIPGNSQNLLVYGKKGSGKTNALRVVMESVMRQYARGEALIYVIDPTRQLLGDVDRLYASGFVLPAKYGDPDADGKRERLRPPGYVSSSEDIAETVANLARLMRKRQPTDATTFEQQKDRTFFTGPEVYVFVDGFFRLTEGHSSSVFDAVPSGMSQRESVTALLASGLDLGVHFIVADDLDFADRVKSAAFLRALAESQSAPILQLAGPPGKPSPLASAPHLKSQLWRTGRGRIIADSETYSMVQTALVEISPSPAV